MDAGAAQGEDGSATVEAVEILAEETGDTQIGASSDVHEGEGRINEFHHSPTSASTDGVETTARRIDCSGEHQQGTEVKGTNGAAADSTGEIHAFDKWGVWHTMRTPCLLLEMLCYSVLIGLAMTLPGTMDNIFVRMGYSLRQAAWANVAVNSCGVIAGVAIGNVRPSQHYELMQISFVATAICFTGLSALERLAAPGIGNDQVYVALIILLGIGGAASIGSGGVALELCAFRSAHPECGLQTNTGATHSNSKAGRRQQRARARARERTQKPCNEAFKPQPPVYSNGFCMMFGTFFSSVASITDPDSFNTCCIWAIFTAALFLLTTADPHEQQRRQASCERQIDEKRGLGCVGMFHEERVQGGKVSGEGGVGGDGGVCSEEAQNDLLLPFPFAAQAGIYAMAVGVLGTHDIPTPAESDSGDKAEGGADPITVECEDSLGGLPYSSEEYGLAASEEADLLLGSGMGDDSLTDGGPAKDKSPIVNFFENC
jgi:hypothetical protein